MLKRGVFHPFRAFYQFFYDAFAGCFGAFGAETGLGLLALLFEVFLFLDAARDAAVRSAFSSIARSQSDFLKR